MSIFTKAISKLQTSDLEELLKGGAVESSRLEFKSVVPDKDEHLKKLSSFANTFGGILIVGAKANSADGKLEDFPGVDLQPGYRQKITQWCFDGCKPPLQVEVSDPIVSPTTRDRYCYVIRIEESDVAPHFVNARKGVWVRSYEYSQRYEPCLASESEILDLLARRALIQERRIVNLKRSAERLTRFRSQLHTENSTSKARLELSVGPRFPARQLIEHSALMNALEHSRISWRESTFPLTNSVPISQHESAIFLSRSDKVSSLTYIDANLWGMLFYAAEIETELGPEQTGGLLKETMRGIHLYRLVGYLLAFIRHASDLLSKLGYEGTLSVDVALFGIRGVPWLHSPDGSGLYAGPSSQLDDEFASTISSTTDGLKDRADALVLELTRIILFALNWPQLASNTDAVEELIRKGYAYNFWTIPDKLAL